MDKHFVLVAKVHGRAVARTEQRGHVVPSFVTFYYTALNYVALPYVTLLLTSNAYFVGFRVAFRISNFCFTKQLRN